jgi:hypothetical protein
MVQGLAVLAALFLVGYGFANGGWLGALTSLVTAIGVGSGLAIFVREAGTAVSDPSCAAGRAQRVGGVMAAALCLGGAWYGGWRLGWLWGLGGYLAGMLVAVLVGIALSRTGAQRR